MFDFPQFTRVTTCNWTLFLYAFSTVRVASRNEYYLNLMVQNYYVYNFVEMIVRSHVPYTVNVDKFNTLLIFCYVSFLIVPFRV